MILKMTNFQAPEPVDNWEGIIDCTSEGQKCVQMDPITEQISGSEDCLNLNVFTREVSIQIVFL